MLKIFFKIFSRGFSKNKLITLLGICGLSIGLTSSFLVALWVHNEFNYDSFHRNNKNIYRVVEVKKVAGAIQKSPFTPVPLADVLVNEFSNIRQSTFIKHIQPKKLTISGDDKFYFDVKVTNNRFFDVFSFPFVQGNKETALAKNNSVVLSEDVANKLFGNEDAIGRQITIVLASTTKTVLEVGAVVKVPQNSHVRFDALATIDCEWFLADYKNYWNAEYTANYVLTHENQGFTRSTKEEFQNTLGKHKTTNAQIYLQPLKDIHLHTDFVDISQEKGNLNYVILLVLVALFILVMAIVNFSNLIIGKSIYRLNEVGVKKVFGKSYRGLVGQFVTVTLLLVLASFLLSLLLLFVFLPFFKNITDKELHLSINVGTIVHVFVLLILIGIGSACYPALHVSSYSPLVALRRGKGPATKLRMLKTLLAVQFGVAIILISSTLVVYRQLIFMQNKNLGFNRENIICMPTRSFIYSFEAIKAELLENPNIVAVTADCRPIFNINFYFDTWSWEGTSPGDEARLFMCDVDPDYLKTYQLQLKEGTFLPQYLSMDMYFEDEQYRNSLKHYVINEAAQKLMGFKEPVGKLLSCRYNTGYINKGKIVGVVKDFHFNSLHDPIQPLVLDFNPESFLEMSIKTTGNNSQATLKYIDEITQKYRGDYPFEYYFLTDKYKNIYATETTLAYTLTLLTVLSLFIAIIGVLSQTTHAVVKRRKEMSIRKVYGAESINIRMLLVFDFVKPLVFSLVASIPVILFFMGRWLNNFAYHVNIGLPVIGGAGLMLMMLCLLSVGIIVTKVSNQNPVENLAEE